jgi:hypothetical protein
VGHKEMKVKDYSQTRTNSSDKLLLKEPKRRETILKIGKIFQRSYTKDKKVSSQNRGDQVDKMSRKKN